MLQVLSSLPGEPDGVVLEKCVVVCAHSPSHFQLEVCLTSCSSVLEVIFVYNITTFNL